MVVINVFILQKNHVKPIMEKMIMCKNLWGLEQPTYAAINGVFIGANNRVGIEESWKISRFYGYSYFVTPSGKIIAQGDEIRDELVVADLNLSEIEEVRNGWSFLRDRSQSRCLQ